MLKFAIFIVAMTLVAGAFYPLNEDPDSTLADSRPLAIRSVTMNGTTVPTYGKVELRIDLTAQYTNPFDPNQIDVEAKFTSPSGEVRQSAGFLYQPFEASLDRDGKENLSPLSLPYWMVRFAPDEAGNWHVMVSAKDRTGKVNSEALKFRVIPSSNPGFVEVSKTNPRAFAFKNNSPFFAVGEDMCWGNSAGTFNYAKWLPKLHKGGGNWIRIWMWSYSNGIEWSAAAKNANPGFRGLGSYNLANAWHLDKTLDLAEANNIYCMICLGTFGEFTSGGFFNEGEWSDNPYNTANGGPCIKPDDFWTNPIAQQLYKQRLRYIMARYGYRTNIQSWEFWNETWAPASWIRIMAQYLKGTGPYAGQPADPYRHLLTTSYGKDDVWNIPEIDWTQTHLYGMGDTPDLGVPIAADAVLLHNINKPYMMSEFGIDWRKSDEAYDPDGDGVDLHNGIWAAAASGDAGTAMIWWWDSYIAPKNLYGEYNALSKTVAGLPLTERPWTILNTDTVMSGTLPVTYGDCILPSLGQWGKSPSDKYDIDCNHLKSNVVYPGYLFSPAKPDLRTVPTFAVNFPKAGQFIFHIGTVSQNCTVHVLLDGKLAKVITVDANPPVDKSTVPSYKSTVYQSEWKTYNAVFDCDYSLDVPAGKHSITLDLSDGDWLTITQYRLTNYRSSQLLNVNLCGITDGKDAFLWAQNALHTWKDDQDHTIVPVIRQGFTVVHGLKPGRYKWRWLNTTTGETIGSDNGIALKSGLFLRLPDIASDAACIIGPN